MQNGGQPSSLTFIPRLTKIMPQESLLCVTIFSTSLTTLLQLLKHINTCLEKLFWLLLLLVMLKQARQSICLRAKLGSMLLHTLHTTAKPMADFELDIALPFEEGNQFLYQQN